MPVSVVFDQNLFGLFCIALPYPPPGIASVIHTVSVKEFIAPRCLRDPVDSGKQDQGGTVCKPSGRRHAITESDGRYDRPNSSHVVEIVPVKKQAWYRPVRSPRYLVVVNRCRLSMMIRTDLGYAISTT
jgi:hypothetical protein